MRIRVSNETLDGAINNAMIELSITSDRLKYEIIQEGTTGFLGIGSKPFIIEAYDKEDKEEQYRIENEKKEENKLINKEGIYEFKSSNKTFDKEKEEMTRDEKEVYKQIEDFIKPILNEFDENIKIEYETEKDKNLIKINLIGDKMGVIIGKHGQTLDVLQHLLSLVVNKGEEKKVHIRIDSENYRKKRSEAIENLARSIANTVRKTKRDKELNPMSSYERRIIHSVLQKEKNIETISVGSDKNRHVIVKYRRY